MTEDDVRLRRIGVLVTNAYQGEAQLAPAILMGRAEGRSPSAFFFFPQEWG